MTLVSNNIKYLRKLNGLTQEQFSQRIGIKRSLLGAYEEARANPNWNTLITIAKLFNTSVDQLLKQDLRKIRETPDLSLPIGSHSSLSGSRAVSPPPIFNDDDDEGDFIASPPSISDPQLPPADRELIGAEPQPLVNVLEKYYKAPSERPTSERNAAERNVPPRPNPMERAETDRSIPQPGAAQPSPLYEEMRARSGQPVQTPPFTVSRPTEGYVGNEPLPAFNSSVGGPARPRADARPRQPGSDGSLRLPQSVWRLPAAVSAARLPEPPAYDAPADAAHGTVPCL